ncbi:EVE domain protein [Candidatus Rubidus massiliensis]|nr:EVE domain protein [Candidatus Rubidus massiliensis]
MRYWIGVVSKEHVMRGVQGGFAQVCHGKEGPLKQMRPNDWIIYYSPTLKFGEKEPCKAFTAIGRIEPGEPYPFQMSEDFIPYRRNVKFFPAKEVSILPLIDSLTFIQDKKKWGFPFRRGCFFISESDFSTIATQMEMITAITLNSE